MTLVLERVSTNAGFMQNCSVEFVPGLNCIIGARGTCKSTLVESILFAFDHDKPRVDTLVDRHGRTPANDARGLIANTLGAGTVRVQVASDDVPAKADFTVEREIGSAPRVYQDGVREYADPKSILERIEIYSQGELLRIATDDKRRIELIDRPHKLRIDEWKRQRTAAAQALAVVGEQIRQRRAQITQLKYETRDLAARREELVRVLDSRPSLPPELHAQIATREKRQAALAVLETSLLLQEEMVRHAAEASAFLERLDAVQSGLQDSGFSDDALVGVRDAIEAAQRSVQAIVAESSVLRAIGFRSEVERLANLFTTESETYYRVLSEQETINEALKKEDLLRKQVEHLEKIRVELDGAIASEATLIEERSRLRSQIASLNEEIYHVRSAEVAAINAAHAQFVLLDLIPGTQSQEYVALLADILSGSRLRSREDVAEAIVSKLSPSELIELVESGDHQGLAAVLDRDLAQASRIITHLENHPRLYDVESVIPDDVLEISMYDNGQPKPVSSLSSGQKATALLPLILRPLPYPLIIDQPEDDLDNRFVFQSLVAMVQNLTKVRQIVFVTHNANIPVLGQADRVIVMSMNGPFEANPPLVGTVDERAEEIIGLLEGGREAFLERQHRYEAMLFMTGEAR